MREGSYNLTVECDLCPAVINIDYCPNESSASQEFFDQGWTMKKGYDLCPKCKKETKGKDISAKVSE
jgi:hypothetical protein